MKRTVTVLGLISLLAFAPAAHATYDPVGGGATRLVLDKRFAAFLERDRVDVVAGDSAERRGRALILPVSGGYVDSTIGQGEIDQDGMIVFRNARRRVPLRKLTVKTTHAPLVGKVGGSQLKIATSAAIRSQRQGFGVVFTAKDLRLTAKVATRFNKKLRPSRPFSAGQLIGTLVSRTEPLTTAILPTGRVTLVFDSAFVAKLNQHFISLNPVFPAEHVGSTFTLPIIANGALAPSASLGVLRTGGEIEFLELGAGQVFWHEPWFDLGAHSTLAEVDVEPAPPFPGKLGQVPMLDLGAGTASSDPASRTIGLAGAALTMTASTAATFNQAFSEGTEDFRAGELVGVLSFAARGQ